MLDSNINSSQADTGKEVTNRLLDVAENLFSEKGFDATSVRDITSAARCNVAAINYHFGGKNSLYSEVFRRRLIAMRDIRLASIKKVMSQTEQKPTLKQLIREFATAFIEPILEKSSGRRFLKLLVREMSDPHLPRKMFVDEIVTPTLNALGKAIAKLCPDLDQKKIFLSIMSLIGQLVHIIRLNELFDLGDFVGAQAPSLAEMVDHVVEFSTAAIQTANKRKD